MLSDKQLIDLMVSEPSWEDVIVKIIAEEQMDPWNIDIIRLADTFYDYLQKIQTLDLRTPARFILITAILLRMKSDILAPKREKLLIPESDKEEDEMLRILAQVPPLQPPLKRIPLRNVTINELITALKKAFEVKERRVERKRRYKRVVANAMPLIPEEDISDRIDRLLDQIYGVLEGLNNIEFSRLVKSWKREDIVETLIPLLHLAQDGKISYSQKELFKEILIGVKNEE